MQWSVDPNQGLERVAVGCGSAGELISAVRATRGAIVLSPARRAFTRHSKRRPAGMTMLLLGHYASERFGVEELAQQISDAHPELECWASRDEADPIAHFSG